MSHNEYLKMVEMLKGVDSQLREIDAYARIEEIINMVQFSTSYYIQYAMVEHLTNYHKYSEAILNCMADNDVEITYPPLNCLLLSFVKSPDLSQAQSAALALFCGGELSKRMLLFHLEKDQFCNKEDIIGLLDMIK